MKAECELGSFIDARGRSECTFPNARESDAACKWLRTRPVCRILQSNHTTDRESGSLGLLGDLECLPNQRPQKFRNQHDGMQIDVCPRSFLIYAHLLTPLSLWKVHHTSWTPLPPSIFCDMMDANNFIDEATARTSNRAAQAATLRPMAKWSMERSEG